MLLSFWGLRTCRVATSCSFGPSKYLLRSPKGHILCDCDEITWESLRDAKVILCQSELGGAIHDRLITHLAQFGYSPWVERLDVGREALMHLVALGLGVSFTSEATVATPFPEVTFRPIAGDAARIPFSAVRLPTNDTPALRRC